MILYSSNQCRCGETADALDSKSSGGNTVWVQIPPPAPYIFERKNLGATMSVRHNDTSTQSQLELAGNDLPKQSFLSGRTQ